MKKSIKTQNYSSLITALASLIEQGRKTAVRHVNTALVATYWLVGRRIVEYEQKGKERLHTVYRIGANFSDSVWNFRNTVSEIGRQRLLEMKIVKEK